MFGLAVCEAPKAKRTALCRPVKTPRLQTASPAVLVRGLRAVPLPVPCDSHGAMPCYRTFAMLDNSSTFERIGIMTKSTGKAPTTKTAGRSGRFEKRNARSGQLVTVGFATSGPMPGAGFLAKTKLKKAGGSLVMTMPASARNLLHLTEGQEMAVSVEGSRVVMEPLPTAKPMRVRRPKYTLDELVAGYSADPPLTDEERTWMDAPPVGREIW